jgi:hypothetical protein
MSWSYNLLDDVGKLRLELGDTDYASGIKPNGAPFEDEELQFLIDQEGTVLAAAARACELLSVWYARAVDTTVGELSQSLSQIAGRYATTATDLRKRAASAGSVPVGSGAALLPIHWIAPAPASSGTSNGYGHGNGEF